MSASWAETPEVQLWEEATDVSNPERREALGRLFEFLTAADRLDEATQTGYVWFEAFEPSIESALFYDCAFKVSCVLTIRGELDESRRLVYTALARPYFDDAHRERGFLHWHQSANLNRPEEKAERLSELQSALDFFSDCDALLGLVHMDFARVLDADEDVSERLSHLTKAVDFLQGGDADATVAEAKEMAAEALFVQGHLKMAWEYANDAKCLFSFLEMSEGIQRCNLLLARVASAMTWDAKALKYFAMAATCRFSQEEKVVAAKAMFYRAVHLYARGEIGRALKAFRGIEPVFRSLGCHALADEARQRLT
jgi:tetratricopeptide (TPR) repeat protein